VRAPAPKVLLVVAATQAVAIALVMAALIALPLPAGFFMDYGAIVGPLAWLGCAFVAARLGRVRTVPALVWALAGLLAFALGDQAGGHMVGGVLGVLVFATGCSTAPARSPAGSG
jgi:hypothetical protein